MSAATTWFRHFDWSAHPLGPISSWSPPLQAAIEMVERSPSAMFFCCGAERYFFYNETYSPILGQKHPDAFGKPIRDVWPEVWNYVEPLLRSIERGEALLEEDSRRILHRHGVDEETYFTRAYTPVFGTAGRVEGFFCVCIETTERVLAQRADALESQQFKAIFAESPASMALLRGPEFVFEKVNPKYHQLMGNRELVGKSLHEALPELVGQPFHQLMQKVFETGETFIGNEVKARLIRRPNGELEDTYFDFTYSRVEDGAGNPYGVYIHATEITDKIQARDRLEVALRQTKLAREELYAFFMQAPVPLCILLGADHRFFLANPLYEQFVGGRAVIGKTLLEVFAPEEVRIFVPLLDRVFQTGVPYIGRELPLRLTNEQGAVSDRWIDIGYHAFREDDGTIKGVLATVVDVTDQVVARRRVENLARDLQTAVQARDEFLSIASHELKTPITSLKMQLQMTRRAVNPAEGLAPSPEKLAKTLDLSNRQIERLTALIEDLLDISRMDAGKMTYRFESVNLSVLVGEVLERFAEQILAGSSKLETVLADDATIVGDRFRLEQVVTNLLTNAMKYGAGTPIEIRVTSSTEGAQLIVSDQGMGIALEKQAKIFDRFERAIAHTNISGLGLGLYITKQIIDAHGGTIDLKSALGKGTTFAVTLPPVAAHNATVRKP